MRKILKPILHFVAIILYRVKKVGEENVPKEGAFVLCGNHVHALDAPAIVLSAKRKVVFIAKAELFENRFFGGIISRLGAFPVHRGKGDVSALKASFKILKDDGAMLIFPEGGRVKNGKKSRAKSGVAMIAQKMCVPVIPVYIDGDYKWMHKITVIYGEPISFEEYRDKKLSGDEIQLLADNVLETIYSLG